MEKKKEWYDAAYELLKEYRKAPEESIYYELWKKVLSWITDDEPIIDLGCGPGQFAELAIRSGKKYCIGMDFSRAAIRLAKKRLPEYADRFKIGDLNDTWGIERVAAGMIVILEVLEHIEDDIDVVESIDEGIRVIFTVPNFEYESHVRCFKDEKGIRERYGKLLDFVKIEEVDMKDGNVIWVCDTVRK
jgi:2-polyprenyl-3-methyl-5-hydroxy-6-metoxy-1,4-benzoquinol methylase